MNIKSFWIVIQWFPHQQGLKMGKLDIFLRLPNGCTEILPQRQAEYVVYIITCNAENICEKAFFICASCLRDWFAYKLTIWLYFSRCRPCSFSLICSHDNEFCHYGTMCDYFYTTFVCFAVVSLEFSSGKTSQVKYVIRFFFVLLGSEVQTCSLLFVWYFSSMRAWRRQGLGEGF